jgi:PIN domain nuclease of toxin-antitoxin system
MDSSLTFWLNENDDKAALTGDAQFTLVAREIVLSVVALWKLNFLPNTLGILKRRVSHVFNYRNR